MRTGGTRICWGPPQWSRSRRSGATRDSQRRRGPARWPQWSRSRRSGATNAPTMVCMVVSQPQWSRSRRSGATTLPAWRQAHLRRLNGAAPEGAERQAGRAGHNRQAGGTASMEPLPKERSDATWKRVREAELSSLNGAAPEGAERHAVPARFELVRGEASMEPLPKERSDRGDQRGPHRVLDRASMEPLPKERSDLQRAAERLDVADLVASMEPLPKERSDGNVDDLMAIAGWPQWSRSRRSGATALEPGWHPQP